jgi:hypothetical protein
MNVAAIASRLRLPARIALARLLVDGPIRRALDLLTTASPSASTEPALATPPDVDVATGSELAVCVPVFVKLPAPWF